MEKERKRRKTHKRTITLLALLLVFIVIAAIGVYQSQHPIQVPANQYFSIPIATVNFGKPQPDGSWVIYDMEFQLEAVGGDAHDVVVRTDMPKAQPENFVIIEKGQRERVQQQSPTDLGYLVEKTSDGKLPFPVKIVSREAKGTIIIDLLQY